MGPIEDKRRPGHKKLAGIPARVGLRLAVLVMPLVITGLLFVACGGQQTNTSKIPGDQASGKAPDFEITAYQGEDVLGGQEVTFSELLTQGRPVVLNMWAGLCPPCRVEMPDLQEVHEEYEGRVLLFGLDVGPFVGLGSRDDGRALLEELKVTYPNGTTFNSEVVRSYNLLGMPTTYFIKPNGDIQRKWTGLLTRDKMTELVEDLIKASSTT